MNQKIEILLVDDHAVLIDGLRALLKTQPDFEVVGEASTGRQAVEMVRDLKPDVAVMDVRMPDLNGCDAARQAIAAVPTLKVVALSGLSDEKSAVEMLKAGAVGFVRKESAFTELVDAIRAVTSNRVHFTPAIIAHAANLSDPVHGDGLGLSPREREVLQLISEGKGTKEVAMHLSVSIKTAETHRRNIMEKLHTNSIAELTKYAIREGLTGV
jgi:DNA-binding NarL/FixJ family response regulator